MDWCFILSSRFDGVAGPPLQVLSQHLVLSEHWSEVPFSPSIRMALPYAMAKTQGSPFLSIWVVAPSLNNGAQKNAYSVYMGIQPTSSKHGFWPIFPHVCGPSFHDTFLEVILPSTHPFPVPFRPSWLWFSLSYKVCKYFVRFVCCSKVCKLSGNRNFQRSFLNNYISNIYLHWHP